MNEIDASGAEVVRHEQVLAAAQALAAWAHVRQAVWADGAWDVPALTPHPTVPAAAAPVSSAVRLAEDEGSGEPLSSEPSTEAGAEPSAAIDWHAPAARAVSFARRMWPSAGRAFLRASMAGAFILVMAAVIFGARAGLHSWQQASAARSARAVADAPAAPTVTPPVVNAVREPVRSERRTLPPGAVAALELPKLPAGIDGWIKIVSPFTVTVSEGGRPLWLYDDTAKLSSGTHRLQFENRQFGYTSEQDIVVHPGGQTTVSVVPPPSTLTVNAPAGSEVSIDGTFVGVTPLVGVSIALGKHDVVVKDLTGLERRFTLTVTPAPVVLNTES